MRGIWIDLGVALMFMVNAVPGHAQQKKTELVTLECTYTKDSGQTGRDDYRFDEAGLTIVELAFPHQPERRNGETWKDRLFTYSLAITDSEIKITQHLLNEPASSFFATRISRTDGAYEHVQYHGTGRFTLKKGTCARGSARAGARGQLLKGYAVGDPASTFIESGKGAHFKTSKWEMPIYNLEREKVLGQSFDSVSCLFDKQSRFGGIDAHTATMSEAQWTSLVKALQDSYGKPQSEATKGRDIEINWDSQEASATLSRYSHGVYLEIRYKAFWPPTPGEDIDPGMIMMFMD